MLKLSLFYYYIMTDLIIPSRSLLGGLFKRADITQDWLKRETTEKAYSRSLFQEYYRLLIDILLFLSKNSN